MLLGLSPLLFISERALGLWAQQGILGVSKSLRSFTSPLMLTALFVQHVQENRVLVFHSWCFSHTKPMYFPFIFFNETLLHRVFLLMCFSLKTTVTMTWKALCSSSHDRCAQLLLELCEAAKNKWNLQVLGWIQLLGICCSHRGGWGLVAGLFPLTCMGWCFPRELCFPSCQRLSLDKPGSVLVCVPLNKTSGYNLGTCRDHASAMRTALFPCKRLQNAST